VKLLKKTTAVMLALVLFLSATAVGIETIAAQVATSGKTVLQNDLIKITVDNATGRYAIRTVEGQPIRKNDQNVNLMFQGDDPETSFTTFRIDGDDYIFGNPYKFGASLFSETTTPKIVGNPDGTRHVETTWKIKGVEIKQVLMLYTDNNDKANIGNVNIRYEVINRSGARVELGSRILLDTMVAGNDGPAFQIGTAYKAPLLVERKLVHDPAAIGIPEEDVNFYKLPPYWVMRDKLDLNNPQATNVIAYGFNNFAEGGFNIVDEMIVGHWNGLANTKWDYNLNPNLDYTRDTNDYGTADSAVAFYWNPRAIEANAATSFETVYGLGEIIEADKVFSIRYLDPPQQLATLADNSAYDNKGIFDITVEIENLAMFNMEHSYIESELTLQGGLNFVRTDEKGQVVEENGKVVTETFRSKELRIEKEPTPEEAEQGIKPKFKPGDTITVSYKVQAVGRPWPVTREYMMAARSLETTAKLTAGSETADDGLKAQYESSQSNFILLPAVGDAVPTYVYGLTPKELYSTDVKYITMNLSNIEAYNTGSDTTAPNFDLYIREKVTGKRYKVPVRDSVLIQSTDDGYTGDMRITYRDGEEVDSQGRTIRAMNGPELPLGEYQMELDYKGTAGGDEEMAAMFDLVTDQTFLVTDNNESRIREANIVALYRQNFDLTKIGALAGHDQEYLDDLNSMFPGAPFSSISALNGDLTGYKALRTAYGIASNATDRKFDLTEFLSAEAYKEIPLYQYKLFYSEQELNEFMTDDDYDREGLVVIRGMVKEVGTGATKQVIVDTKTEPAIINQAVAYKGKDLVFVRGKLEAFGKKSDSPFVNSLFIKGDGTLSVASSGFIFHRGEWTLDFFNGFEKSLGEELKVKPGEKPDKTGNEEDNTLNGGLTWAAGAVGDRFNPLRQVMIENVYFNRQSLFAPPAFAIGGFGFTFNDFILREGGVSFGGSIKLKIVEGEVENVIFNDKGFVGVDAALKFELGADIGLINPSKKKGKDKEKGDSASGEIKVVHYVQPVQGVANTYGIKFKAELKDVVEIDVELAFKQVKDGRILPDVIGFGTSLGNPGVLITGATYLTKVRGAIRELADTIAGGSDKDPFPLVVQAGVSMRFGVAPAYFFGDVDLTVKRTGLKIEGKLGFSMKPDADEDDLMELITKALLEAQWVTPWFVRVEAEVDIGGWEVIVGKAGIFIGQNLEKNRTDFEGFISSRIQIPSSVPVVGGLPISSVFFGLNNDKIWGSFGVLFISVGVTYYWGGGIEFGTSGESLPDGLIHMIVEDPERGPTLMVIGQGMQTLATSWLNSEQETQEITYRTLEDGVKIVENGSTSIGIGGINVTNGGRVHQIPMNDVSGNAIIEMAYDGKTQPAFTLKDANGANHKIVFDNTNTVPGANAFSQIIPAKDAKDGVDSRKVYIVLPEEKLASGGTWTLTADRAVDTRLLNVPVLPELSEVTLTKDENDSKLFTASWNVNNAQPGDKVNLYLTQEPVSAGIQAGQTGVPEASDPGLMIAKDLPVAKNGSTTGKVTSGNTTIDVSQVTLLGGTEDIRGMLQQGNYYLRAELKSDSAFGTKTSRDRFEIIDPLAPQAVSDVVVKPAGNGLFALSFKPKAKKNGHGAFEHSYMIEAQQAVDGKLVPYPAFGDILFTEAELEPFWNAQSGQYENILIGGWSAMTIPVMDDKPVSTPDQTVAPVQPKERIVYTGLEVGKEYVIGVSSATKPTKEADKNEAYHFANRSDAVKKLLPIPAKPNVWTPGQANADFQEVLTNQTKQTIQLVSDQKDVEVEAFNDDQSLGKVSLTNTGNGSAGSISIDQLTTDGTYAVELVARNKNTRDMKVTMLYLTVDTIAPKLFIEQPVTGERTSNGEIRIVGSTTNDAVLTVNGQRIELADNGDFDSTVTISGNDPVVDLNIVARDGAGNENTAVVGITNDSFRVPTALILEELPTIKPGESRTLVAKLRYVTGKQNGKPTYVEETIPAGQLSNLSYEVSRGESVKLDKNGKITAQAIGVSLIEAEYRISDEVVLEAATAAKVANPKQTALRPITASTAVIPGVTNATQLQIQSTGDMTGQQLVYKVYAQGANAALPSFDQDLNEWKFVPQDGKITVSDSDRIVVAARTSLDKKAMAVSAVLTPKVYKAPVNGGGIGPGGGGGGGAGVPTKPDNETPETPTEQPTGPIELSVGGQKVEATWNGSSAALTITDEMLGEPGNQGVLIQSQQANIKNYTLKVDQAAIRRTVEAGSKLIIDLPLAKLELDRSRLEGLKGDLELTIRATNASERTAEQQLARTAGGEALGSGDGVTITSNLPATSWSTAIPTQLVIPSGIRSSDITAVVLRAPDGSSWTTVPWKLDGTQVDVQLTGEGQLFFVHSDGEFRDVRAGYWAQESIQDAASKLFVLGKGDGRFDPGSQITRAEYPTILLRVAGWMNKDASSSYTDVQANQWFNRSVSIASEMGIVNGMADGSYQPQASLTRAEAMTMVGRLLASMNLGAELSDDEVNAILSGFADEADIPQWARRPVALSVKSGIITGDNNQVKPTEVLTRAQAAAIAIRLDRLITDY